MFINKVKIKNYRCFEHETFEFKDKLVIIEGDNGSGKTSILEALNYMCFLKSFRTNRIRDLVKIDENHFFLQVEVENITGNIDSLQVGLSFEKGKQKKLVKLNKKTINSYKELVGKYRAISLSEDDLELVKGSPEIRRSFIDQLMVLIKPENISLIKQYKQILEQRNKMILNASIRGISYGYNNNNYNKEFEVWTNQLWNKSKEIEKERKCLLKELENNINDLLSKYFCTSEACKDISVKLEYTYKFKYQSSFDSFFKEYKIGKVETEHRFQRSLFGTHLDDFLISFHNKKARHFASRGQQKLVIFLLKISIIKMFEAQGKDIALLLDDFLTDFDEKRLKMCLKLIEDLPCQTFITCPIKSIISDNFQKRTIQRITL